MPRIIATTVCFCLIASLASAGPIDELRKAAGRKETRPRRSNDNVEGTVWEYRAEIKAKPKAGEKPPKPLEGRFRTEGEGVFEVGRRLRLPGGGATQGKGVRGKLGRFKQDATSEVKLPSTQVKRIGEYRRSKEKLIIEFNDPKSLNGTMVLRQKKRTKNVWHGDFKEKEGKKVVRKWEVEVRKVED